MTDQHDTPWRKYISDDDIKRYQAAGFGVSVGLGKRPAMLIIDAQYRTVGREPKPFFESVENEYRTSCGEVGWQALRRAAELRALFHERGWPVLYPYVAPKNVHDEGSLGAKVPAIMSIPMDGYEFVDLVAPKEQDILVPKRHPSAFFGTPLVSYLIQRQVDTLVVTGATTSGCVRSSVVDAFSYNFRVAVPHDAVYDRAESVHAVSLFDMDQKYADVMSTEQLLAALRALPKE